MQIIRQIVALILIIAVGYYLYIFATSKTGVENKLTPNPNNTITLIGTVSSNQSECNTGKCLLIIKNGKTDIFVIYNTGDEVFCGNEVAAIRGKTVMPNTRVKVYGYYSFENNQNTIRTCSSPSYYIETI